MEHFVGIDVWLEKSSMCIVREVVRVGRPGATAPNQVWSMDVVSD
jgi:hypothetical protein